MSDNSSPEHIMLLLNTGYSKDVKAFCLTMKIISLENNILLSHMQCMQEIHFQITKKCAVKTREG